MKSAFVYTDAFAGFDYGPSHPLKTVRLKLVYELIDAYGLLSLPGVRLVEPAAAGDEELLLYHEEKYLDILKAANSGIEPSGAEYYGLGPGDNPVFRGLFEWSALVAGASLRAAELVDSGEVRIAFNIAGGLHHAMASHASGFCYINDPVIAIKSLLRKGKRVAYIDIDAHHGDGVQAAFYDTDKVLTISLHETGRLLFPGTGFETETGAGQGEGYAVNVPMPPYSDDDLFLYAFEETVPPLIERFVPDIVVAQLGVDSFVADPLTHLNYTTNGFCEAVRKITALSTGLVALGGGGYDIANVARAWTLAWAVMNGAEPADDIPQGFLEKYRDEGFRNGKIRDEAYLEKGEAKAAMRKEVERVVGFIRKEIFPLVKSFSTGGKR
jgi:acetoin utilization protein AcuC